MTPNNDMENDLRRMRQVLDSRITSKSDDFWFNGKLWSEMTDEEKDRMMELLEGYK